MNYETLSDFEINKRVAISIGINPVSYPHNADKRSIGVRHSDSWYEWFDYCNNPSDAWPIIVANKIWIQPDMVGDGFWHCYDCENEHFSKHQNPLRAAMIVFLKMQEAQRG